MRTLTGHEKKLMLLFGLAVGAGLHLLVLKLVLNFDQINRRNLLRVSDELAEAQTWISQKEEWSPKIEWLDKNLQPVAEGNPSSALQKAAQSAATSAGLKIEEQTLQAARTGTSCTVYGNRMRLTGSLEQFIRWGVTVYQPGKGMAITSLNLKLSPEPPKMIGEAESAQFFKAQTP